MKPFTCLFSVFPALCLLLTAAPPVHGQSDGLELESAEQVQYNREDQSVTARGGVVLNKGERSLRADVVTYNTQTEQAEALGNVVFINGDQVWKGEELRYNFLTEEGDFPDLRLEAGAFTILADSAERMGPLQTRMRGVTATTCAKVVEPEFALTAGAVDVYEENIIVLRHPVFRLHGVPFFWLPKMVLDQEREPTNVDIMPGYSSRDGATLHTRLTLYPSPGFASKTRLDYRGERGVAVGQEFYDFDEETNRTHTRFRSYFALDDSPYKNENEEASLRQRGVDLEEERYRVDFFTRREFTPNDTLIVNAAYWSDSRVTRDFLPEEFRRSPVPETRATYNSRGEGWIFDLDLSRQLNDGEFDALNRLPEATFTVPRRRLGEWDFLYESESRAGFLQRTFSDFNQQNGAEDFETLRLHSEHRIFYPTRHFGWLNVVPRAGVRATYYEETLERVTEVRQVSNVSTNNVITTALETNSFDVARSGQLRLVPELGLETSFKAFGMVHDQRTALGKGLRHVVEPFANYTYIPEPDPTPDELYQFDRIDRLDETHFVGFGVRNKWQTKQPLANGRHRVRDLVNLNLTSSYDLRSEADPSLGDLVADLELNVVEWMKFRTEVRYDTDEGQVQEVESELALIDLDSKNTLTFNQRFREDRDHTVQVGYSLNPEGKVGLTGYSRFELEDDGFEEQQLLLRIETDCVGYGIGGKWTKGDRLADGSDDDDDYEVWFQFWLTAFPRTVFGLGGE